MQSQTHDKVTFGAERCYTSLCTVKASLTKEEVLRMKAEIRCKEKLNTLAISVMNQWPGVKLRVTEGWDEEGKHATDSLHYEGRAVDVTTSDRDRSKYGMLARLAVEAGFDWVYYESRSHIHCSVKSESSSMGKSGGCFPGNSLIRSSEGEEKPLSEVKIGERIAALDTNGNIVYSEVIAFLDRSPEEKRQFVTFTTSSGRQLTLTPAHLIPVVSNNHQSSEIIFAERVKIGDRILIQDSNISNEIGGFRLRWDSVIDIKLTLENGVYAPLTREGTVLVNDVVASCYAIVDSQTIAHYAFMPFRFFCSVRSSLESASKFIWPATIFAISEKLNSVETNEIDESPEDRRLKPHGVHWYASFLFTLASYVLPTSYLY
ncbi:hypothetical protein PV325_006698 [Microctonus aethiopoides]|nr:hypothetical protein PV325_006698 [Microctonus aethiopoides]KAK0098507.1 hypothetical protein PV326_007574 [Microctonus aethiopoides]